ncbi:Hsp20/alpha crystallin family protein [Alteribacillus bidgolensis]|uniref:Molecular chaperone IbpA, HSP20 family n=1 Tax=Alteribacillus bidgolensis TaxID=930129 RepID=A0A1G8CWH5_9BACI|nr:Hsp20/alpha crystallin family protein [Alteribacillus bidgolensis]SDH49828.1 Molecular chaperone IbpA, HSP20 family [Alteribacillus bidgolensis]
MDNYFVEWEKAFKKFFQDEFWNDFNHFFAENALQPQVNLYESKDQILCIILWPLLKTMEDVDIKVYNRALEVSGRIKFEYKGFRLIQQEIFQGDVKRKIELPYPVRQDNMESSYDRGLLKIRLDYLSNQKHKKNINVIE